MTCEAIPVVNSFVDWIVWPTECNYYFWLLLFVFMEIILAWKMYKAEEARTGSGDFLASLAVSSIAFLVVALIGTLVTNTAGVPMIQSDIFLYFVASSVVFVLIWIFKQD